MTDDLDDLFSENDFLSTPAVARYVELSESQTRAIAADIGVSKAGQAFVWCRDDVQALVDQLDADDDSESDSDSDLDDEEGGGDLDADCDPDDPDDPDLDDSDDFEDE
jgi:hypothetical protein